MHPLWEAGKREILRLVSKPIAFPSSLLFSPCSWWKSTIPGRVSLTKALNKIVNSILSHHETKHNADVMHLANLTYMMLLKQMPPVTHQRNTFPRYCLNCLLSPSFLGHPSEQALLKITPLKESEIQLMNNPTGCLSHWQGIKESTPNLYPL